MRVTLHRVDVTLYSRDYSPFMAWKEFAFEPSGEKVQDRGSGFKLVHPQSRPVEIEVPIGSTLLGDPPRWLKTHFNQWGLDAAALWHLANQGEHGVRLVEGGGM